MVALLLCFRRIAGWSTRVTTSLRRGCLNCRTRSLCTAATPSWTAPKPVRRWNTLTSRGSMCSDARSMCSDARFSSRRVWIQAKPSLRSRRWWPLTRRRKRHQRKTLKMFIPAKLSHTHTPRHSRQDKDHVTWTILAVHHSINTDMLTCLSLRSLTRFIWRSLCILIK